jgi:phosphatidylserine decarboxylase
LGRLEHGTALQAKGITYGVGELLGDPELPEFRSGSFLTIYLSPRHYHRVHAPCRARLHTARVIPGHLLPVHPGVAGLRKGLFTGNERLVTLMESNGVSLAVVAIGAFNVGSISADFDPDWQTVPGRGVTNRAGGRVVAKSYIPARKLNPGDPLASFYLGSTVVLLIGEGGGGRAELHSGLQMGSEIRVGAPILTGLLGDSAEKAR